MRNSEGITFLDDTDDRAGQDSVVALYKMECSITAQKLRVLADAYRAAQRRGDADFEWFADTVAIDVGSAVGKISSDLALALQLTDTLPRTLALLAGGELDLYRVRKIADATRTLTPEQCAELEERIYPDVLDQTVGRLLRRVNRAVAELNPDLAEQRRQRSRADRHVWCEPEPTTGMGWLNAYLPGDDLAAISQRLDTLATSNNDGIRTMDQRRADTLRDLLLHVPTSTAGGVTVAAGATWINADRAPTGSTDMARSGPAGGPVFSASADAEDCAASGPAQPTSAHHGSAATTTGAGGGVAATIYVTVSADTLLGLDQRAGDLRGYGPITAEHARELAYRLQSEWVGVLVDDNGRAVTMTRNSYRFRGRLAEFIRLRDATCTHPGCDRPADRCDIDHLIPWPRGQTTPDNASTECRRHHRLKTLTDWTVHRDAKTVAWINPDGQTFTKPIEPISAASPTRNSAKVPKDDPAPF